MHPLFRIENLMFFPRIASNFLNVQCLSNLLFRYFYLLKKHF